MNAETVAFHFPKLRCLVSLDNAEPPADGRYDAEWLRPLYSPTDNSGPRLDWTLFILNQE
jgi:hypothetical protein